MRDISYYQGRELAITSIVLDGVTVPRVVEARPNIVLAADGRVYGHGGCNRFMGSYKVKGDGISFSPLASTMMYCEGTMEVEGAFFQAMGKVSLLLIADQGMELLSADRSTRIVIEDVGVGDVQGR